ncbi:MAG: endolytic transglycosylase MltG [Candidatus Portnoybacteria bacterium CG10_big_fil_rev_8_21_14_0_10_36_7]|uniref:Endolytic murein transglycosylase n=1 Tax=Candidatus Portnoybacteria bacterium CG10_big_fil_rev_8_21_14_0_10_36_7 TaxID=1974812 RepID=A0A2M8KDP4_9BACT|nr:MAG: endolytic transglycosylase MltG [Candidatus Portnoybacteria bacterium CG10_big_fil_rev_8_21_14_0_10_36_7]
MILAGIEFTCESVIIDIMSQKVIIIISAIFVGLLLVGALLMIIENKIYHSVAMKADEKVFIVNKGERSRDIAQQLVEQNLIASNFSFQFYLWQKGYTNYLQVGEYSLSPSMTIAQIAKKLRKGQIIESTITIPDGYNLGQIAKALNLEKDALVDYDMSTLKYDFLSNQDSLEGYLFPDTYNFQKNNLSVDTVVKTLLDNFDKKLSQPLRDEISLQGKTIQEIITLASIVQREAASVGEMPAIAGVFYNRLEIGMALQSDATVNYATGKSLRQATESDIKINSPHNTYKFKGLPPGPIASPGLDAIKAVVYSQKNNYFYFLHPNDGGPAVFSKTVEEHNKNRYIYLK